MRKQSLILLPVLLCTSLSQASISLDMRADYLSSKYDGSSSSANNSKFVLNMARVDAKGKLNEAVDYRMRFRLSSDRAVSTRDGLGSDVDFMYINNKLNDNFSLTVGKFASDAGGHEGVTASPELFMQSIAYADTSVGTTTFRYYTGAKVTYLVDDQEVALHVTNLNKDATGPGNNGTASQFDQNKNMVGLVYKGKFLDKKLQPILSYHSQNGKVTGPGQNDNDYKNSYIAAGLKYDFDLFTLEGDYLSNKLGSLTTLDQDDKMDTILIGGAYRMNEWTGRLKLENTIQKTETSATVETKNTYNGYQAAIEYKPAKDEMFRYHMAFWSREKKSEVGSVSTTTTDQFVLVGTRILADFLK